MDKSARIFPFLLGFTFLVGFGFIWLGFNSGYQTPTQPVIRVSTISKIATSSSRVAGIEGESAYVTKVVDGDTIVVDMQGGEYNVRFVGIDTPETVDPRRPVGCYGKEASNETKDLLTGKEVILQKDITDKDKYNRLLRLVFLPLPDGRVLFVNDYLVRTGFAKVYDYPPDLKFSKEFTSAQEVAKQKKLGMWGSC